MEEPGKSAILWDSVGSAYLIENMEDLFVRRSYGAQVYRQTGTQTEKSNCRAYESEPCFLDLDTFNFQVIEDVIVEIGVGLRSQDAGYIISVAVFFGKELQ